MRWREAKEALTPPAAGINFQRVSVCQCESLEKLFDQREASAQLERARRKGPRRTTRLLIERLRAGGVAGKTLLDIGGGVGVIQQELLKSGLHAAIGVDASSAYLKVAEGEMLRLGLTEKVRYYHGNFVDVAPTIPTADLVTLDRVICCYDDLEALLAASSARTRSTCALVYPRDAWWMRLVGSLLNAIQWLRRDSYRFFVHASSTVEEVMHGQGLTRVFHRAVGLWQVVLYAR
jgi:2-polyprenyl-3-methyl-5-hydroxy-6-metoxy-1,4-benzoquinol methylase